MNNNEQIVDKQEKECPYCNKSHEQYLMKRDTEITTKGVTFTTTELYVKCTEYNKEKPMEYIPADIFNINDGYAMNAYMKALEALKTTTHVIVAIEERNVITVRPAPSDNKAIVHEMNELLKELIHSYYPNGYDDLTPEKMAELEEDDRLFTAKLIEDEHEDYIENAHTDEGGSNIDVQLVKIYR